MIVADVLGPWHRVEVTDGETGLKRMEERRLPQFMHDVGISNWRDVTSQASAQIPPTPTLCVWRVWCDAAQLAQLEALPAYEVLRSATVDGEQQDPDGWVTRAAKAGAGVAAFETLPATGWLELGAIYLYGGTAYIVRQSHNRTEHPPADAPALFMVHRMDATSLLEWVAGEQVYVGTRRTYGGATYVAIQAHVTQVDWTPPAVPTLWRTEAPPTGAWAAGVAYKVNDQVTYDGKTYKCLQAHTSQAGWTPSAVPALWQVVA